MSDEATKDTQPAIEAAAPVEPASIHSRVTTLETRVTTLENTTAKGFKDLSDKTDLQNVTLGRIEGLLTAALKSAAKSPRVQYIALILFGGLIAWLRAHGFKIPYFEDPNK